MVPLRAFFLVVLSVNALTIAILGFTQYNSYYASTKPIILQEIQDLSELEEQGSFLSRISEMAPEVISEDIDDPSLSTIAVINKISEDSPYRFTDPAIALNLLQQLDVFSIVDKKSVKGVNFTAIAGGFKPDYDYCERHRAFIVENPQTIFEENNVITSFFKWHKLRKQVLPMIGAKDMHPGFHLGYKPRDYKFDMKLNANIFYMMNLYFYSRQVGTQYSCLSQSSNHIPGHEKMYRKDNVGKALVEYAKGYVDRPQCFNYEKWFPKTFILQNKEQCEEFFAEFLSSKYQELKAERNIVYFRKIGANVHEGKGVFPVNDEEEILIQNLYKNGTLCGKVKANNLIQYNVHNLLLVKNRKFGFRSFLLVASTNPLIAYYHDGYARLSLNEYDPKSNEKKTFVTNIGVNLKEASKGTEWEKLTPQQIQDKTCWSMQEFSDHMREIGRTNDINYLNNTLKPEFKKVMIHLLRMASSSFQKKSSVFETYGLDFVMDDDMKLWFIEANTKPLVNGFTNYSTILLNRMMADTFEIVRGLLKSRMKRVITYINTLTKEVQTGGGALASLEERREEFRVLSQNYFEPEFEISSENTFERIIYEKDTGIQRYSGLISEECL